MTTLLTDDLAARISAELVGDGSRSITGALPIDQAGPGDLSFVNVPQRLGDLAVSRAGAVVIDRKLLDNLPVLTDPPPVLLIVDDALVAFLELLTLFRTARVRPTIGLSPAAHTGRGVTIGEATNVLPGATVGDDVVLGDRCDIFPGVFIGDGCRLGDDVVLFPNVVLDPECEIGDRVIIHAAAVIGADGFGYRFEQNGTEDGGFYRKIPHLGTVRIEDDVEIGAGTTIDRGMITATVIGAGSKLDNQVMIGHNCRLGRHNAMASQVGVGGSVTTGDYVRCGGQVGIADHLRIGERSSLAAKAAVHREVPPGETHIGYPACREVEQLRILTVQRRLPEMRRELTELARRIDELAGRLGDESIPRVSSQPVR